MECHTKVALDQQRTLSGSSGSIGKNPAKNGDCRIMYWT